MMEETLYVVGFFRFRDGGKRGFQRMDLHGIFKTEQEAREQMSFCDEAGWYEGALIEEREYGYQMGFIGKRIWMIQQEGGGMKEIAEPTYFKNVTGLVG